MRHPTQYCHRNQTLLTPPLWLNGLVAESNLTTCVMSHEVWKERGPLQSGPSQEARLILV